MVTKKKNPYQKGLELEQEFAQYMKDKLEYDKVKVRKQVSGKHSIKGAEADIIGVEHDPRGEKFRKLSFFLFFGAITGIVISIIEKASEGWFVFFFAIEIVAILYGLLERRFSDKYTWVECKNWKNQCQYRKGKGLI